VIIVSSFLIRVFSLGKAQAMVIFPFILLANPQLKKNTSLVRHEQIHWRQALELLVVGFYLWYVLEFVWLYLRFRNWDKAYRSISFEREAYSRQNEPNYLKRRKFWAFTGYL